MSTNTSEKEYFLFFENGENVNQLKNKASKQISLLKKQKVPASKIPKKSQILNDLSKSINGKSYNKSICHLKTLSPYLENEAYFTIPFQNEKNIFYIAMFEEVINYNKDDEYPVENILFLDSNKVKIDISMSLPNIVFKAFYKNIEKIENGWKLKLETKEENPHDNEFWLEIKQTDEGLNVDYYIAEWNFDNGYDVMNLRSIYAFWSDFLINEKVEDIGLSEEDLDFMQDTFSEQLK